MGCRRGSILFQSAYDEASLVAEEDMIVYATHERLEDQLVMRNDRFRCFLQ